MIYYDACRYAHLFLYEYKRRFDDRDDFPKLPDAYCQVVESVLRYGNIPLGDHGHIRYGDE